MCALVKNKLYILPRKTLRSKARAVKKRRFSGPLTCIKI